MDFTRTLTTHDIVIHSGKYKMPLLTYATYGDIIARMGKR